MASQTNPLAGRRFVDEAGNAVVPGRQLGAGGEGTVYEIDGQPGTVVKIWHQGQIPDDVDIKFRHMVNNPVTPELGANWRITWPQSLVTESGDIVGYTMPRLDYTLPWIPIISYYNPSAAQRTGQSQAREIQIDDRVRIASNLALGFKAIHDAGYVIGDINEKNAEANRQNDVALMDCDSYGFTDAATGRTFTNNMGRPEFQAPEVQGDYANRTQEQDRFGLAVVIFQLLTGYHPYTVTGQHAQDYPLPGERIGNWLFPPAGRGVTSTQQYNEAWDALTDKQKELCHRCFNKDYEGQPRPTPEEWVEALQEMPAALPDPPPQPRPQPQPSQPQPQPQPQPRPQPQPQPRPQPQPQPRPRPRPLPLPTREDEELGYDVFRWVSALIAYGALIPLFIFSDFRPWLWLSLMLVSALFFYFPVRRLFETPITRTRWIIIAVAAFPSAWFLVGLVGAALSTWPWWMWLGATPAVSFVFLVPARSAFSHSNVRRRWAMIGAASLVALFILIGIGMAGFREWQDWRWQRSLNMAGASGGAVASAAGNAVNGGGVAAAAPAPVVVPTDTPIPAAAPTVAAAAAPPAEPVCGQPTNFRAGAFNASDRSLIYSWDAPAMSDLTVTGYRTEYREVFADGTYAGWERRDPLGAGEIYQAVGPYPSDIDGRTFQNRVYALCDAVYSEPSEHVPFTYPAAVAAAVPTDTPASTPAPEPTATSEPTPTSTPAATATPAPLPTATPLPPATVPPATRTPNQWLIQHPANPKIANSPPGAHVLVQGCYLGNRTSDRRFRLASWDVWDPGRYGNELKFVRIVTNTGANLPLERGACYEARLVKQVDSTEEYVCLDQGSIHPQQTPCANAREREVIPTFILYPSSADNPDDYSDNFGMIRPPP